jgi:hypothetical protein
MNGRRMACGKPAMAGLEMGSRFAVAPIDVGA